MKDYFKIPILAIAIVIVGFIFVFAATNIVAQKGGVASNYNGDANSYANSGKNNQQANLGVASQVQGDVQIVNLKVVGSGYVLTPSVVKVGVPVKIVADVSAMPGCSKAFTIPDFGVQKYFSDTDNTVEFTPNKVGTFKVACTMNMYRGILVVTDDGTANATTTAAITAQNTNLASSPAPTCGMGSGGSGGCGCGSGR